MKKLKILLLTDSLELGGAQTHILSLYESLTLSGHTVLVVSRGGALSKNINHVRIDLASHSPFVLIKSFFALLSLVRKEKFDLLHAHARIPALFAHFICRICSLPLVCTAHARFKLDPLRRRLSVWGDKTVAVSEDLRLYLTKSYRIPPESISVIENGLDVSRFTPAACADPYHLLFLSRLDSDCSLCAELLCRLAPSLHARFPTLRITIGGGGDAFARVLLLAKEANLAIGEPIISLSGAVDDVNYFLSVGGIFIGVSRAAIEAMTCSLPTIIAGNEGFLGHLTPQSYDLARSSNFCARGSAIPDESLLSDAICALLEDYPSALCDAAAIRERVISELDSRSLLPRIESVYLSALHAHSSKRERNPKTLLFGYYGYSNLGDDALLRASILRAKREFGSSVGAFCNRPRKAKNDFCIPCFSRKNPFSLIFRIARCDRLIFGGGTLLQDSTSARSFLFYITVLRLAQLFGKETLLFANGLGRISRPRLKSLLRSTLARCSHIGLRDSSSHAFLKGLLPKKSISLEPDLALSLAPSSASRANFLLSLKLKGRLDRFFVVCVRSRPQPLELFELEEKIRELKLSSLVPLFIVCSPSDLRLSYKLYLKFGGALLTDLSFSDLLSILPLAHLTISMRYHPLLAARTSSCPLLPIGSDPKLEEF